MHDASDGRKRSICVSIWRVSQQLYLVGKDRPAAWVISFVWYMPSGSNSSDHTMRGAFIFGTAIAVGRVSRALPAATGSLATCFQSHGFRSDRVAGPMETAVQDVIGGTLLLMFWPDADQLWDFGAGCPGGDLKGWVASCQLPNTANGMGTMYNQTCLDSCVGFDIAGIC